MRILVILQDLWRVGAVAPSPVSLPELFSADERFQLSIGPLLSKSLLWSARSLQVDCGREDMALGFEFILLDWPKIYVRVSSWRFGDPHVLEFLLQTGIVYLSHIYIFLLRWIVTDDRAQLIWWLLVILLLHLDSLLCLVFWRVVVFYNLLCGHDEGIHNSILDHTKARDSLTDAIDEAKIRLFLGLMNIGLGDLRLYLSLFTWWFDAVILGIAKLYLLIESSLPFCYGLFPLDLVELDQRLLGKTNFRLLVRFNLLQDVFILVLGVVIESSYHLLEYIEVDDLIPLAAGKTKRILKENLKSFLLVL